MSDEHATTSHPGPPGTVRIVIRSGDAQFNMRETVCQDYDDPKLGPMKGCGATVQRWFSYPKFKGLRFDGDPIVVRDHMDRAETKPDPKQEIYVAFVKNDNVHAYTCPHRQRRVKDGKAAAAGAESR